MLRYSLEPKLICHVLDTGYCLAWEHHVLRGGRRRKIACHSIAALLGHPRYGWTLWDTGYAPRMLQATRRLPFLLYRLATPLRLRPDLAVVAQLDRWALQPADIRRVILSHFHADHVAGLRDFPLAEVIATRSAYAHAVSYSGLSALRRGLIPALLPDDMRERVSLLPSFEGPPLPGLGPTHDLFGDGSTLLVALPGHARGQIGLLVSTQRGRLLFAADACWLSRAVHEERPPHPLTSLFVDDARAARKTLHALHTFTLACPDVSLVPSHCPEAFRREVEPR